MECDDKVLWIVVFDGSDSFVVVVFDWFCFSFGVIVGDFVLLNGLIVVVIVGGVGLCFVDYLLYLGFVECFVVKG